MKPLYAIILLFVSVSAAAQTSYAYEFLDLPNGARNSALGGRSISVRDSDLSLAFDNPAHLTTSTHNQLVFNYQNWFKDVNIASAFYGYNPDDKNYTAYGIRYVDYGKFYGYNEYNQAEGTFTAKDIVASAIYSRVLAPHWSCGVTLKAVYSIYEKYQSFGMGVDIGFSYHNTEKGVTAALVLQNAGCQFKGYYSVEGRQQISALPVNLQVGLTYKLPKAPLRFSFLYNNVETWDLSYSTSSAVTDAMAEKSEGLQGLDMFFRHTVWALEVIPTNYLYFVVSYNHRKHRDMAVASKRTVAGFAFGAGFRVKMVEVGFSVIPYQAGSIGYNATVGIRL